MTPRMHLAFDRECWWDERYGVDGPRRGMSKSQCAALLNAAARECRNPLAWVAVPNWERWLGSRRDEILGDRAVIVETGSASVRESEYGHD